MKKLFALLLCALLALSYTALAEPLTGEAKGFGGVVTVTVTVENGKIIKVEAKGPDETAGIGSKALEQLPKKIEEAGKAQVDVVAGATYTSKAIIEAVEKALASQPVVGDPAAGFPGIADGDYTGTAQGYAGEVKVTVSVKGGKITQVTAQGTQETPGLGAVALEEQPKKIRDAQKAEVDVHAGATYTSKAITQAVNAALGIKEEGAAVAEPAKVEAASAYAGFGLANSGRVGPGKDDKDVPVYSINQVYANALFDQDGKILFINVDHMEIATPNYDGASMPHFSGFPGQGGYNYDENHDEKVDKVMEVNDESFLKEISAWQSKRQRGDDYKLNTAPWYKEMNAYEQFFVGKTVDELYDWFGKYTSDKNGRPLKADMKDEKDLAKYNALSEEDKKMLADVTASATMSLKDSHGDILAAIKNAFENKRPLTVDVASIGFGNSNSGRVGPGKDDKEVQVYSVNEVYVQTLFDKDGRIADIYIDQLEFATPNYDGKGMPHFSGFPGQTAYNYDENHDEKVDGVKDITEEGFLKEISEWQTKRQRGDDYKLNSAPWHTEMDAYQKFFIGKTVEEIEQWFGKYTSDKNGRPLKADMKDEKDIAKYNALTEEEKKELADVTASATMSLKDSHGDILAAIRQSFENKIPVQVTIKK